MELSNPHQPKSRFGSGQIPHWGWGLLATVVLVVVGTALRFGIPIYRQHQVIREVEVLGGWVSTVKGGPDCLRRQVGDDWMKVFDDVNGIHLDHVQVTDTELAHLYGLTNLEQLELDYTQITDAGLGHLKSLTNLKFLFLTSTKVTDAGLEQLKSLTKLQILGLNCTEVTDTGLEHLKTLTNLEWVQLNGTRVTDAGLAPLKNLTNLDTLDLDNPPVTDAGIANLKRALPRLRIFTRRFFFDTARWSRASTTGMASD